MFLLMALALTPDFRAPGHVRHLGDDSFQSRSLAYHRLEESGWWAKSALVEGLKDHDPEVRRCCRRLLEEVESIGPRNYPSIPHCTCLPTRAGQALGQWWHDYLVDRGDLQVFHGGTYCESCDCSHDYVTYRMATWVGATRLHALGVPAPAINYVLDRMADEERACRKRQGLTIPCGSWWKYTEED